jgi:hypothetical protein
MAAEGHGKVNSVDHGSHGRHGKAKTKKQTERATTKKPTPATGGIMTALLQSPWRLWLPWLVLPLGYRLEA